MSLPGRSDDPLLRPALEAAVAVARQGAEDDPPRPVPVALRPFVKFRRFSPASLEPARRALESLDDFRMLVAGSVTEADVGRAGWLYLNRPPGWEAELGALLDRSARAAAESESARRVDDLERRLAAARQAATRAGADRDQLAAEMARWRDEASEQRRVASRLAEEVASLRRRIEELALSPARAAADQLAADQLAAAQAAVDQAAVDQAALDGAGERLEAERRRSAALARELDRAWTAVGEAESALAHALDRLGGLRRDGQPGEDAPGTARPRTSRPAPGGGMSPGPQGRLPRRPSALPPGMRDDEPEAVVSLLRLAGAVLVVDGYNVAMAAWPGSELASLRSRLVRELAGLAARTRAEVRVVFDGVDEVAADSATTPSRGVSVVFTATGTEADEVIVEMVENLERRRPVVVATSDREVRDSAEDAGANVVSSGQLLAALGWR